MKKVGVITRNKRYVGALFLEGQFLPKTTIIQSEKAKKFGKTFLSFLKKLQ